MMVKIALMGIGLRAMKNEGTHFGCYLASFALFAGRFEYLHRLLILDRSGWHGRRLRHCPIGSGKRTRPLQPKS